MRHSPVGSAFFLSKKKATLVLSRVAFRGLQSVGVDLQEVIVAPQATVNPAVRFLGVNRPLVFQVVIPCLRDLVHGGSKGIEFLLHF